MTAEPAGARGDTAGASSGEGHAQAPDQVPSVAFVLGTSAGGTGRHVAMLAQACASRGMKVSVYGPARTGQRFFAGAPGLTVTAPRRNPGAEPPGGVAQAALFAPVEIADRPRPARDAAVVLRLRTLLARSAPGVVHAHGLRAGALSSLALALTRRRPPLVVTVHNAPPSGGAVGAVSSVLERIVARRADLVDCVSGDLAERMRRRGGERPGRAVVPAPHVAPPSATAIAAARAGLGDAARPVVIAVGRLARQKGFAALLEAAARWQGLEPAPQVVIVGEGPLESALRARALTAGIDAMFLGGRDDVPALLAAADVVVVPSEWEGQPLVVQEALRAGRPLVASRVGGIPGLTGEDAALLVPAGDEAALAAAVTSVLRDPGVADRLRSAAVARAAELPTEQDAVQAALAQYRKVRGWRVTRSHQHPKGGRT